MLYTVVEGSEIYNNKHRKRLYVCVNVCISVSVRLFPSKLLDRF